MPKKEVADTNALCVPNHSIFNLCMRYLEIYKWQQEAAWQAAVCFTCQLQTSWECFFFISETLLLNTKTKQSAFKVPNPALYFQTRLMRYQEGRTGGNRTMGTTLIAQWPHLESITDEHHRENQRHMGAWGTRFVRGWQVGYCPRLPVRGTFSTEAPIIVQASSSIRATFSRNSPHHLSSHSSSSSGHCGPLHSTTHLRLNYSRM